MSFIDPDELASARLDAEELFPTVCTILDQTLVSDGGGGETVTYTPRPATVACRIAPGTPAGGEGLTKITAVRGDRVSDRRTFVITLPAGTVIGEDDRIQIGDQVYEITLVSERSIELVRRVTAREVE